MYCVYGKQLNLHNDTYRSVFFVSAFSLSFRLVSIFSRMIFVFLYFFLLFSLRLYLVRKMCGFFVVISNISPLLQFVTDSCMCLCMKHGEFTFFWFRAVDEIEKSIEPDNTPTTRIYNNIYRITKKSPGGKWARSRDRERETHKKVRIQLRPTMNERNFRNH